MYHQASDKKLTCHDKGAGNFSLTRKRNCYQVLSKDANPESDTFGGRQVLRAGNCKEGGRAASAVNVVWKKGQLFIFGLSKSWQHGLNPSARQETSGPKQVVVFPPGFKVAEPQGTTDQKSV